MFILFDFDITKYACPLKMSLKASALKKVNCVRVLLVVGGLYILYIILLSCVRKSLILTVSYTLVDVVFWLYMLIHINSNPMINTFSLEDVFKVFMLLFVLMIYNL